MGLIGLYWLGSAKEATNVVFLASPHAILGFLEIE